MSSQTVGKAVLKIQDEIVMEVENVKVDFSKLEPRILAASPALGAPYGQKKRRLKKDCPCPKCQVWRQHKAPLPTEAIAGTIKLELLKAMQALTTHEAWRIPVYTVVGGGGGGSGNRSLPPTSAPSSETADNAVMIGSDE